MSYLVIVLLAAVATPALCEDIVMTADLRNFLMQDHERIRSEVDPPAARMETITWNMDLATRAANWVRQEAEACTSMGHDPKQDRTPPEYVNDVGGMKWYKAGQNHAYKGYGVSAGSSFDAAGKAQEILELAMGGWEAEKECWTWGGASTCTSGHYTQQIWDQSSELGCATSWCKKNDGQWDWYKFFTACNYFPGGNWPRNEDGDAVLSGDHYAVPYVKKSGGSTSKIDAPCKGWASYNVYDAASCSSAGSHGSCSGQPAPGNMICGCARHCLCNADTPNDISASDCA